MALKVVAYNFKKTIGNGSFKIFLEFAIFLTVALQFSQVPGKETKKKQFCCLAVGRHWRSFEESSATSSNNFQSSACNILVKKMNTGIIMMHFLLFDIAMP